MLEGIALGAGIVLAVALARIAALVPGFDEEAVRPMSHAFIVMGLALVVLGAAMLLGAGFTLWLRIPASAMVASWGITFVLVARAADRPGRPERSARVAGVAGLRRR